MWIAKKNLSWILRFYKIGLWQNKPQRGRETIRITITVFNAVFDIRWTFWIMDALEPMPRFEWMILNKAFQARRSSSAQKSFPPYREVQLWLQYLTCWDPNMTAILVLIGSIYDCNLGFEKVHIWLQSWSRWGPNMTAILITKGSKYECNLFC